MVLVAKSMSLLFFFRFLCAKMWFSFADASSSSKLLGEFELPAFSNALTVHELCWNSSMPASPGMARVAVVGHSAVRLYSVDFKQSFSVSEIGCLNLQGIATMIGDYTNCHFVFSVNLAVKLCDCR